MSRPRMIAVAVAACWVLISSIGDASEMRVEIPRISGNYINVYRPAGDVFAGPSIAPLETGRRYDEWVVNDHCFVRDKQGRWHVFGITHPESGLENVHAGEYQSFHALAPSGDLKSVLRKATWNDEPKILPPSRRPGEMPENHAPCVTFVDGVYHMFYGPAPLRHATSTDLYNWVPRGPLANSLVTRDPNLFLWNGAWHILTCGVGDVRMAPLAGFTSCGESRTILKIRESGDPESPTLIQHAGTFYLFVCNYDGLWDQKDLQGAYQHITRVYQSDDPWHFDANRELARLDAHAPEIFQGDSADEWYISSAEWPYRGISIAPLEWNRMP